MPEREESDQLPEEQPSEAVVDDAGGSGDVRDRAKTAAGGASHEDRATGQPSDRRQGGRSDSSAT
jgi:hypothetical protein